MDQAAQKSISRICVNLCPIGGFSFLVSFLFSLWFAFTIGRNLGLFFGGLILASILTPQLIVAETNLLRQLSIAGGIVGAIAIVWLSCVSNDAITPGEWLGAVLVLLIFALAAAGLAA